MIIAPDFVYLHFPKMAGTKVEALFRRHFAHDEAIRVDPRDPARLIWHDSLSQRRRRDPGFDPGERTLVIGLRRLPDWLYSRYTFELARSPHLPHDPERLRRAEFLEVSGAFNQADHYMRKYLPPGVQREHRLEVIRLESFAEDFRRVFGRWLDLSAISEQELAEPLNRRRIDCPEARAVIERHRQEIHAACPLWTAVETRFYGTAGEP